MLPLRAPNSNYPNAQKILQLEGDYDLFGDGSIVVKRWVAHTPGSQVAVVKLKNSGTIILTGDNVYFRDVEKNIPEHRSRLRARRVLPVLRVHPPSPGGPRR